MIDYKRNDPKGWCGDMSRGAALGRSSIHNEDKDYAGKVYLRRVKLNGDYDSNGTYFGCGGPPLYWCSNDDGTIDFVFRAKDRINAKVEVQIKYPKARFYR